MVYLQKGYWCVWLLVRVERKREDLGKKKVRKEKKLSGVARKWRSIELTECQSTRPA